MYRRSLPGLLFVLFGSSACTAQVSELGSGSVAVVNIPDDGGTGDGGDGGPCEPAWNSKPAPPVDLTGAPDIATLIELRATELATGDVSTGEVTTHAASEVNAILRSATIATAISLGTVELSYNDDKGPVVRALAELDTAGGLHLHAKHLALDIEVDYSLVPSAGGWEFRRNALSGEVGAGGPAGLGTLEEAGLRDVALKDRVFMTEAALRALALDVLRNAKRSYGATGGSASGSVFSDSSFGGGSGGPGSANSFNCFAGDNGCGARGGIDVPDNLRELFAFGFNTTKSDYYLPGHEGDPDYREPNRRQVSLFLWQNISKLTSAIFDTAEGYLDAQYAFVADKSFLDKAAATVNAILKAKDLAVLVAGSIANPLSLVVYPKGWANIFSVLAYWKIAGDVSWRNCCLAHDVEGYCGGTNLRRLESDRQLINCIEHAADSRLGTKRDCGSVSCPGPFGSTMYGIACVSQYAACKWDNAKVDGENAIIKHVMETVASSYKGLSLFTNSVWAKEMPDYSSKCFDSGTFKYGDTNKECKDYSDKSTCKDCRMAKKFEERGKTCLCGGTDPTPLCGKPTPGDMYEPEPCRFNWCGGSPATGVKTPLSFPDRDGSALVGEGHDSMDFSDFVDSCGKSGKYKCFTTPDGKLAGYEQYSTGGFSSAGPFKPIDPSKCLATQVLSYGPCVVQGDPGAGSTSGSTGPLRSKAAIVRCATTPAGKFCYPVDPKTCSEFADKALTTCEEYREREGEACLYPDGYSYCHFRKCAAVAVESTPANPVPNPAFIRVCVDANMDDCEIDDTRYLSDVKDICEGGQMVRHVCAKAIPLPGVGCATAGGGSPPSL